MHCTNLLLYTFVCNIGSVMTFYYLQTLNIVCLFLILCTDNKNNIYIHLLNQKNVLFYKVEKIKKKFKLISYFYTHKNHQPCCENSFEKIKNLHQTISGKIIKVENFNSYKTQQGVKSQVQRSATPASYRYQGVEPQCK